MTYTHTTTATAIANTSAALDRAAATLDRVDARTEARRLDQRARSLALAGARGETPCSWAARTLGWTRDDVTGALVSLALAIHSAHTEQVYAVGYSASVDDATCDCPAASYGRPCWHRGLAILKGRSVARLYAPAGRAAAARAAWRSLADEGNAAAIAPSL